MYSFSPSSAVTSIGKPYFFTILMSANLHVRLSSPELVGGVDASLVEDPDC